MLATRTLLALAAFAASVSAFTVTAPRTGQNFTTDGSNVVSWTTVASDRKNFTIVLSNGNPADNQQLKALVDATSGTTTVDPPSTGWPAPGAGPFQINLVQDTQNLNAILAQSSQFFFAAPKVSAAPSPSGPVTQPPPPTQQPNNNPSGSSPPAPSDSGLVTPPANGAASMGANAGLVAALVLLGAVLA
ncbi:hypothetical protein MIND_00751100 [Mycena indigotica]|uniref:Yeast cell wall synthesis Kre9/Knh1-like N-terminal domain-containing protein n=1 Tax=Mycena indigotica TaxID=2126181 RepID=A0A8H6SN40_9AGAR|nr:uncharacterized protein MIND_00751100 [Mycena indigotica]KAF7301852.1 hypothetical protein MIND_00751100 [Mycena indigotica]